MSLIEKEKKNWPKVVELKTEELRIKSKVLGPDHKFTLETKKWLEDAKGRL